MSEKSIFNKLGISLGIFIILWIGLQLAAAYIVDVVFPGAIDRYEWLYWLVASGPMYLVAFPVALKLLKNLPSRKLYEHHMPKVHFPQVFFMTLALMYIGNIIGLIFTTILTSVTGTQFAVSPAEALLEYKLSWVFLISVVIAPIIEETLFRKVLIDRLIVFGDGAAIFLSALMFGLMHGNFTQFFYAFFIGLIFGFIYIRTGKVKYSISLHMLINFCGGFMPAVFMKGMDLNAIDRALMNGNYMVIFQNIGALLGLGLWELLLIILAIVGFILLIVRRREFFLYEGELQLTKSEVVKNIFTNPGMWLWVVVTVALFAINILWV